MTYSYDICLRISLRYGQFCELRVFNVRVKVVFNNNTGILMNRNLKSYNKLQWSRMESSNSLSSFVCMSASSSSLLYSYSCLYSLFEQRVNFFTVLLNKSIAFLQIRSAFTNRNTRDNSHSFAFSWKQIDAFCHILERWSL